MSTAIACAMAECCRDKAKREEWPERKEGVPGVLGGVESTLFSDDPFLSAGLRAARLRYSDKFICRLRWRLKCGYITYSKTYASGGQTSLSAG